MPSDDSRFHSIDIESFQRYIAGCVVVVGDSTLWLNDDDGDEPVCYIAVIHDGSGVHPRAAIHISEIGSTHDALEQAFDALREHTIEHYPEYVKELRDEWGEDEWEQILTGSFDGMTWTLPKFPAAWAIYADMYAARHVDIDAS